MAADDDVIINVKLVGADTVKKQFEEDIGKAGSEAVEKLTKTVQDADDALNKLSDKTGEAGDKIRKALQDDVGRIGAEGLEKVKTASDQAQTSLAKLGQDTPTNLKAIGEAAKQSGSFFGDLVKGVREGASSLGGLSSSAGEAGAGIAGLATKLGVGALAFGGIVFAAIQASEALLKHADSAAKAANAVGDTATKYGQSIKNYQEALAVLEGIGLKEGTAKDIVKEFGDISVSSFDKAAAAAQKLGVSFPPTVEGIKALVGWLERTVKFTEVNDLAFGRMFNVEPIFKMSEKLQQAASVLKHFGGTFDEVTGKLQVNGEGIKKYAEFLDTIKDPVERLKQVVKDFGKTLGPELNEALKGNTGLIGDIIAQHQKLGDNVTESSLKAAKAYRLAQAELKLFQSSSNADLNEFIINFGTTLTKAQTSFVAFMLQMETNFVTGLKTIGGAINSVIDKLIQLRTESQAAAAAPVSDKSPYEALKENTIRDFEFIKTRISEIWESIKVSLGINDPTSVFSTFVANVIADFELAKTKIQEIWTAILAIINPPPPPAAAPGEGGLLQNLFKDLEALEKRAQTIWDKIKGLFSQPLPASPISGVGDAADTATPKLTSLTNQVGTLDQSVDGVTQSVDQGVISLASFGSEAEGAADTATDAFDGVINKLDEVIARALQAAAALAAAGGGGGTGFNGATVGAASGGRISGPGTGTSDSILAWLSNGEFVHSASAVSYYGHAFMNAINKRRIPKGLMGFAAGGNVSSSPTTSSSTPQVAFKEIFIDLYEVFTKPFEDAIENLTTSTFKNLEKSLIKVVKAVKESAFIQQPELIERGLAFASGGIARGPGTGTSDSLLARVSNGEGILTAKAVQFYGAGLVHMLNSLQVPQFAAGGIMGSGFSARIGATVGDKNGGTKGRPFIVVLDGKKHEGTLSGPGDMMKALEQKATFDQVRSAGNKPGWVS